ncbi:hypothetical protein [Janthinobacterium sp.]|uniref:hypothetical protein n=1 Tax=Janthinobacterium sp. TaxID=1871054 RepID=UPI00262BC656|nr:hypothetical protein [Janthinobacterium sp.]
MEEHSSKPPRTLGANLEHAEDFIADAVKGYTSEKIQELATHDSETSNALYQSYLAKFPNSFVGERDIMLHESRFKYVAAEHAGGKRFLD